VSTTNSRCLHLVNVGVDVDVDVDADVDVDVDVDADVTRCLHLLSSQQKIDSRV
jgi:hypothetical protein